MFGEADNVVSIKKCENIFSASKTLTVRTYPGAHHGFDLRMVNPPREFRFGMVGYDAPAAKAAWTELEKFLKR